MKKFWFLLWLVPVMIFGSCASHEPSMPVPSDRPLYGFTAQGVFFLHESLVKAAAGTPPRLISGATDWKAREMKRVADYYVYDCRSNAKDRQTFQFYNDFKVQYLFEIGMDRTIPSALMDRKELFHPKDLVASKEYGFALATEPVENPYL